MPGKSGAQKTMPTGLHGDSKDAASTLQAYLSYQAPKCHPTCPLHEAAHPLHCLPHHIHHVTRRYHLHIAHLPFRPRTCIAPLLLPPNIPTPRLRQQWRSYLVVQPQLSPIAPTCLRSTRAMALGRCPLPQRRALCLLFPRRWLLLRIVRRLPFSDPAAMPRSACSFHLVLFLSTVFLVVHIPDVKLLG